MGKNQLRGGPDLVDEENEDGVGLKQCPGCGHRIQRKLQQQQEWLGLPAGVKFDPTDQELLEHLEAKVESQNCKSHPLIDEFIPTIEGDGGICYTHPEKLPGVTRNGLSRHYFHRPSKAYTTGTRKRRKIQTECDIQGGETRWHKTGKTRAVMVSGKQKGCKKILVLYTNFGKNRKPEKTNWVMHQYHLGMFEEEKEGELVVSKIFYQTQPRQCSWSERSAVANEGNSGAKEGGGGGGGCDDIFSLREVTTQSEEVCGDGDAVDASDAFPSYIQHLKSDHTDFSSFQTGITQNEKRQHIRGEGIISATGLEEVVLRCTPPDIKNVPPMGNANDSEWMKYTFWQNPNDSEHHI